MSFQALHKEVEACTRCPRLVEYCRDVAEKRKKQFADFDYWGRPVPGCGAASARMLIVGLAPAAHGSNRTGRMFTGDGTDGMGSGDFLARSLHAAGFAKRDYSHHRGDGQALIDAYMTAIARCAPPGNKPTSDEVRNCAPFLHREIELLTQLKVIVCLGKLAFDQVLRVLAERGAQIPKPRPKFVHACRFDPGEGFPLVIGSYHPSRQNTQTGRLDQGALTNLFQDVRTTIDKS